MKALLEYDLGNEEDESSFECSLNAVRLWNAVSDMQDHPKFKEVLEDNGLDPLAFKDELEETEVSDEG